VESVFYVAAKAATHKATCMIGTASGREIQKSLRDAGATKTEGVDRGGDGNDWGRGV
jgi:hypothetical protein